MKWGKIKVKKTSEKKKEINKNRHTNRKLNKERKEEIATSNRRFEGIIV